MSLTIRSAEITDLPAILEIVNDEILNSTAIFSHHVVTLKNRREWFEARRERNFPVLVAVLGKEVLGFASFGEFRPHDGYLHTVEHSVYVHRHHHAKGVTDPGSTPKCSRSWSAEQKLTRPDPPIVSWYLTH